MKGFVKDIGMMQLCQLFHIQTTEGKHVLTVGTVRTAGHKHSAVTGVFQKFRDDESFLQDKVFPLITHGDDVRHRDAKFFKTQVIAHFPDRQGGLENVTPGRFPRIRLVGNRGFPCGRFVIHFPHIFPRGTVNQTVFFCACGGRIAQRFQYGCKFRFAEIPGTAPFFAAIEQSESFRRRCRTLKKNRRILFH